MQWTALLILGLAYCAYGVQERGTDYVVPPAQLAPSPYPDWAHHHWAWLSHHDSNRTTVLNLARDYLAHGIKLGAVDIDSEWETGMHTFEFDDTKYPDAAGMIKELKSMGLRVILWTTSVIDEDSPNYQFCKEKGYFLNGGKTVKWWHGTGSFIDYTNPEAVKYWHSLMDNVLDMGVDGFKTDGTDPFTLEFLLPKGKSGYLSERKYADLYYRDFLDYSRTKNPEALIMARPIDAFDYKDHNFLYFQFAPKDVMYSGWVGDQDGTFQGMKRALENMIHSAWKGYANYGSDIGGYRGGGGHMRATPLFTRWFQMGAFVPLMENGGDGEHRPWMYGNDTLATYRTFVDAHYELVPYLLTSGADAIDNGHSVLHPADSELDPFWSYAYGLGDNMFVAPVTSEDSKVDFTLPKGATWVSWWDSTVQHEGGTHIKATVPMDTMPVFVKKGSAIPLDVSRGLNGHGDESSTGALTWMVSCPEEGATASTHVREWKAQGAAFSYTFTEGMFNTTISAHGKESIVLLRGVAPAADTVGITLEASLSAEASQTKHSMLGSLAELKEQGLGVYYDKDTNDTYIRLGSGEKGILASVGPLRASQ